MSEISIKQVQEFINSKNDYAVSENNISLNSLFATAEARDIALSDGDYSAPHKLSEFYGSKFLTLLGPNFANLSSGAPDTNYANYQFSAGGNNFIVLGSSSEFPTWLGSNTDHGPFPQNNSRFYHILRIGVNGSCTYYRINIVNSYYWQNLIGTWSGGGEDGTQPIIATFVNELPVHNRTRTDPVCGSGYNLIDYLVLDPGEDLANYTGPFGDTVTLTFNPPNGGWEAARSASTSSPLSVFGERLNMQTNTVDGAQYEYSANGSSC